MRRGRGTHDVELVEDATGAADARGSGPPDDPAARRRTRRRWWAAGAAGAVVVAGLVTAQQVVDAGERERLARVLEVPGAVVPPPDELGVRWASAEVLPSASGRHDPWTLAGLRTRGDGGTEVAAVDAATGADRWVVPLLAPTAPRDGRGVGVANGCAATDGDRLVCLTSDTTVGLVDATGRLGTHGATTSRLVVVDVRAGEVAADHTARSGTGVLAHAFTAVDDRAVLVGTDEAGGTHAWAVDLASGRPAWEVPLPAVDPGALTPVAVDVPYALPDGTVAVVARDGAVTLLDPADGRLVRGPVRGTSPVVVTERLDGRAELAVPRGEDADVLRARADLRVPGRVLAVTVDDGSLPGVLLTVGGGRVHAVDEATGDVRWEAEVALADAAAVLDGRVHVTGTSTLLTLDGRTGERLWERPRWSRPWSEGVLTDGTLLYEPRAAEGTAGRPELVGLDPADGGERRVVALSGDVWSVVPRAGVLVQLDADAVRVLG